MMAATNGGACGRRVAQMSPKEPNDVDGGRCYRRPGAGTLGCQLELETEAKD